MLWNTFVPAMKLQYRPAMEHLEGQIIRVPLVAHQFRVNGPAMEHPKIIVPLQEHHILANTSYGNSKIPYEKIKKTLKFSDFILFPFALSYL